jgi:hypothetical protein
MSGLTIEQPRYSRTLWRFVDAAKSDRMITEMCAGGRGEVVLQIESARARHPHIKDETSRPIWNA